ncbi:MAG: UDP-galactopyranose mutase [Paludibacteraceae bacterium]|nr:UDP-galactopyranose mutase [Paludibacteraceae bacterium]
MKQFDYLIVGSGLFGATVAYRAHQAGKRCLVIDRRAHTGGNVYQERVEGIDVHTYGPHIFHTSNAEVWRFVTSLVEMNRFVNSPIARYEGKLYHLPFNMNTFAEMWGITTPEQARQIIEEQRADILRELNGKAPRNLEEQALCLVGRDLYQTLIKGYTEKQWGRPCTELPAFIIKRLPVRFTFDNNYFNDRYQGVPVNGYNELIAKLLEGSEILLGVDYLEDKMRLDDMAEKVVYTGSLDEYFGFSLGHLEYRTVRFDTQVLDTPNYQGNAVINYTTADVPYTRVIEHKHFNAFGDDIYSNPKTVVSREYSVEWKAGMEQFYPLNNQRNNELYARYAELAKAEGNVLFGGRLAEYTYYDMDKVIEKAIQLAI